MNSAQKTLLLAAAIVVACVLHLWFCRWEVNAPYSHDESMLNLPFDPRAHSSLQIVGSNTPDERFHAHTRFSGLAVRNGTPTTAVIGGVIAPFVILVCAALPLLTPDRQAVRMPTR